MIQQFKKIFFFNFILLLYIIIFYILYILTSLISSKNIENDNNSLQVNLHHSFYMTGSLTKFDNTLINTIHSQYDN